MYKPYQTTYRAAYNDHKLKGRRCPQDEYWMPRLGSWMKDPSIPNEVMTTYRHDYVAESMPESCSGDKERAYNEKKEEARKRAGYIPGTDYGKLLCSTYHHDICREVAFPTKENWIYGNYEYEWMQGLQKCPPPHKDWGVFKTAEFPMRCYRKEFQTPLVLMTALNEEHAKPPRLDTSGRMGVMAEIPNPTVSEYKDTISKYGGRRLPEGCDFMPPDKPPNCSCNKPMPNC